MLLASRKPQGYTGFGHDVNGSALHREQAWGQTRRDVFVR
jgi:hypothetical protein